MSIAIARKKRTALYLSICGLLLMVAAVTAISARDPDGLWLRVGQAMITAGMAMWLPPRYLFPAVLAVWLGPNAIRANVDNLELIRTETVLELPGLLLLAAFSALARRSLSELEEEDVLLGTTNDDMIGIDQETGVYEERLLLPALEAELARSRRFSRSCALVLAAIDQRRERFDYRDDEDWEHSLVATAGLFRGTRNHIDRVYRYGTAGFALLLPESGAREVQGLVRRLRRVARSAQPGEGQPGGPLPVHFGATFFPLCATSTDDMIRRAEVALRLAEKNATRLQLDGAEAPELPPPTQLRQVETLPEQTDDVDLPRAVGYDAPRVLAPSVSSEARARLALVDDAAANGTTQLPAGAEPKPGESLLMALSRLDPNGASQSVVKTTSESAPETTDEIASVEPSADDAIVVPAVTSSGVLNGASNGAAEHVNAGVPSETAEEVDGAPEPALDDMSLLLKRMDETLGMIRTLRSNSTPQ